MIVTLIKPHTHAGRDYPAGVELDLPHSVAVWLHEQGVAQPAVRPAKPRSQPNQSTRKEG
ncbi:MAG: hypothetical protein FNT29_09100 [Halothiobacillaceae bacterium]|nr:MAG: hypothetical protein FNT29_09100 [Halothiobacillaceae bacterium]